MVKTSEMGYTFTRYRVGEVTDVDLASRPSRKGEIGYHQAEFQLGDGYVLEAYS